jgi:GDP-L-fucose synthase
VTSKYVSKGFWNKKRVVVTGGAGFLGTKVVERLIESGASEVFVPRSINYNLVNREDAIRLLKDAKPNIVIHLAAKVGGIWANKLHPAEYFYENLMMGVQLFHSCWQEKIEKFVSVGTVCSYPKFATTPFSEDALWDGYPEETNAPYGLAKKMLLVQSQTYRDQYGFNSINLLPANLYGPGDNFDDTSSHVIPALIKKCVKANNENLTDVEVWGTGSASREFLFVDDAAKGIVAGAEFYNCSEPVNLGSGEEVTIKSLASKIAKSTRYGGNFVWDSSKPDGQPRRKLDTSRALKKFGFQSETKLSDGLKETAEWYSDSILQDTNFSNRK